MASKVQALSNRFFALSKRGILRLFAASPERQHYIIQKLTPLSGIGLAIVFIAAFSLPIFALYQGLNYFWRDRESVEEPLEAFPEAIRFAIQGAYAKIDYHQALSPSAGNGFVLGAWFKLNQMPAIGQRIMLLSKFDPESKSAEGYAIGITRDASGYRPIVYWRSAKGSGGWYLFSKFAARPRTWFLLSLSFRSGNLLGLHGVPDIDDQSRGVELLGGYELEENSYPTNTSAIVFGAYGQNPFRGFLGPVAIFNGPDIGGDIHGIVKRLLRKPEEVPDTVDAKSVVAGGFLGANLISPLGIHSEVIKPANRKRPGEGAPQPDERD